MKNLLIILSFCFTSIVTAQEFNVSAELRPRFENKHGFGTLLETEADGTNFVSQRTRLNFGFFYNKIKIGVSLQNVRVWGDVSTLSADDNNTALHVAWAEAILSENFSIVFGRQEIDYDDSRIFGNVNWAQQARSHDAMIAKWQISEKHKVDVGFALNADNQSGIDALYSNVAGYKAFQYAWYHGDFTEDLGLSFLLLNNGVEFENINLENEINYSQTIGTHITYKNDYIITDFSVYFQTGEFRGNDVGTSNFAANLKFKVTDEFLVGIGGEYLSGKDMNDTSSKIKSFSPLYGTNHKFNGWMDYFYVGNHANSVGLIDINATIAFQKDKFSVKVIPHYFASAADIYDGNTKVQNNLGVEIDTMVSYKFSKAISMNAGFSTMLATESMEVIKGGDKDEFNSWTWVMITFKPNLFTSKSKS